MTTPKTLAKALRLCTPFIPKSVQLHRSSRGAGQLLPKLPDNQLRVSQAVAELKDISKYVKGVTNQLTELESIPLASEHDADMFGA